MRFMRMLNSIAISRMVIASIAARTMMRLLAFLAADKLFVTFRIGTIDNSITGLAAMCAMTDDYVLIGSINGDRNTLVKYIAFPVIALPLNFRVLSVFDNAAIQLTDICEPGTQQIATEFFTTDTAGAIGQHFFIFII